MTEIKKVIDAEMGIAERAIEKALQKFHDNTGLIPRTVHISAADISTSESTLGDRAVLVIVTKITAGL
jgi:hypothetical protein